MPVPCALCRVFWKEVAGTYREEVTNEGAGTVFVNVESLWQLIRNRGLHLATHITVTVA